MATPAVPPGYIDMAAATRLVARNRNFIASAARAGQIPDAFQFGTARTAPWYFTEAGLRAWMTGRTELAASA